MPAWTSFAAGFRNLTFVRNDVYARFSHAAYNKGTALSELARRLGLAADNVFAAGDHLNDLPMLTPDYARWLVAPANAVEPVKVAVRRQNGYVSPLCARRWHGGRTGLLPAAGRRAASMFSARRGETGILPS